MKPNEIYVILLQRFDDRLKYFNWEVKMGSPFDALFFVLENEEWHFIVNQAVRKSFIFHKYINIYCSPTRFSCLKWKQELNKSSNSSTAISVNCVVLKELKSWITHLLGLQTKFCFSLAFEYSYPRTDSLYNWHFHCFRTMEQIILEKQIISLPRINFFTGIEALWLAIINLKTTFA